MGIEFEHNFKFQDLPFVSLNNLTRQSLSLPLSQNYTPNSHTSAHKHKNYTTTLFIRSDTPPYFFKFFSFQCRITNFNIIRALPNYFFRWRGILKPIKNSLNYTCHRLDSTDHQEEHLERVIMQLAKKSMTSSTSFFPRSFSKVRNIASK